MHCVHAVLPAMIEARWGRIITWSPTPAGPATPSSRSTAPPRRGPPGFSRGIAREVGRHGITVNSVALGTMRTPLTEAFWDDPDHADRQKAMLRDYVVRRPARSTTRRGPSRGSPRAAASGSPARRSRSTAAAPSPSDRPPPSTPRSPWSGGLRRRSRSRWTRWIAGLPCFWSPVDPRWGHRGRHAPQSTSRRPPCPRARTLRSPPRNRRGTGRSRTRTGGRTSSTSPSCTSTPSRRTRWATTSTTPRRSQSSTSRR